MKLSSKLFQNHLRQYGSEIYFFLRLLESPDQLSKSIQSWIFQFEGQRDLNPDKFKEYLNMCIQIILTKTKTSFRQPFTDFNVDTKLCNEGHLTIEPFGYYTSKVKFSCIILH